MTRTARTVARACVSMSTLAIALAGCGDARATGGWTGTVDTLANGAVLVSSPEQGVWDESSAWRLEEELRIGSAEVEGPELFGNIAALAVDELGRIYVADRQASEIRVFDSDGAHVRTFGRKGGGPGELEEISGMGWGPGGNLWVMDPGNTRLTVFDTAGVHVTSHRRPGGYVMIPWRGGFDRHDRVYDATGVRRDGDFRDVLARFTAEMAPIDTFWVPAHEPATFEIVDQAGRRRMSTTIPYAASQVWTFDGNGDVWIGTTDIYRLHRVTFAGDTVQIVEKQYSPVPVTEAEKDERIEAYEWFTKQGGKIDRSRIPGVKPAYGGFFFDDQGYLWVVPSVPEGESAGFDVFEPEGRYQGRVTGGSEMIRILRPLVRGEFMYGVVVDDLDVPYVVRNRIQSRTVPR